MSRIRDMEGNRCLSQFCQVEGVYQQWVSWIRLWCGSPFTSYMRRDAVVKYLYGRNDTDGAMGTLMRSDSVTTSINVIEK